MSLLHFFSGNPFGLSISDTSIHVLQCKDDRSKISVTAIGEKKLSKGIVVKGEIHEEKKLSALILELLANTKPGPLKQKDCVVTIPSPQSFEYVFHLSPDLEAKKLEAAIYDKIFEKLPFTEAEIKYDYVTYSLPKTKVVFVVAMKRLIIAQYYAVLKSFCNLNPISLEPESLSLLRNIPFQFDFYKGHFLIHVKEHAVQWFSFFGGLIFDSKSIPLQGKTHKKLDQVDDRGVVKKLADDIERSLTFFRDKTDQDIGEVIIAGYQEQLPSLAKDLQSKISCPVKAVKNYRMDISKLEANDPQSFYLAAGAALKGLGLNTNMPINLLRKGTAIDKVLA